LLRIGNSEIPFKITQAFEGQLIPSPDRVLRKEAPEKTWKTIPIGILNLKKGEDKLVLKSKKIALGGIGDIFSIRLIPTTQN
jgi:hypothetical protein